LGWLSGWQYRKSHQIVGSTAGAQTDYQIRVKTYYGSGTDNGENVYLNGKCRADFGDVRFTASDGTTLLNYWIEEKSDGNWAIFWVKVPSIPASPDTATIYIYYGKTDATTTSDPANTMLKYHGFEDGTFGPFTYGDAAFTVTSSVKKIGNYGAQCNDASSSSSYRRYPAADTFWALNKVAVEFWLRTDATSTSGGYCEVYLIKGGYLRAIVGIRDNGVFHYWTGSYYTFGTSSKQTWYKFVVELDYDALKWNFRIYDVNRNLLHSYSNLSMGSSSTTNYDVMMFSSLALVGLSYWDEFFSRKWVSPEPGHGSWGSEETAGIIQAWSQTLNVSHVFTRPTCLFRLFQNVNTAHVFRRPFRFLRLTQALNTSHVYLRHRFTRLLQTLKTLHVWTLPVPAFLKQWTASLNLTHTFRRPIRFLRLTQTLQVSHVYLRSRLFKLLQALNISHIFTRPFRRISYTQPLQPTHAFRRPVRIIRFPAIIQLAHLFSRPTRFMKLIEQLTLGHAYFVAVPSVKKTKLFLVIGDLAIQLYGD